MDILHDADDLRVAADEGLEKNILIRQFLGEIRHIEDGDQGIHWRSVREPLVEDIAVCNDQVALTGQDFLLLQPDGNVSADHIVQFNMLVPVEVKKNSLLPDSVPQKLDGVFLVPQNLFFV